MQLVFGRSLRKQTARRLPIGCCSSRSDSLSRALGVPRTHALWLRSGLQARPEAVAEQGRQPTGLDVVPTGAPPQTRGRRASPSAPRTSRPARPPQQGAMALTDSDTPPTRPPKPCRHQLPQPVSSPCPPVARILTRCAGASRASVTPTPLSRGLSTQQLALGLSSAPPPHPGPPPPALRPHCELRALLATPHQTRGEEQPAPTSTSFLVLPPACPGCPVPARPRPPSGPGRRGRGG